MFENNKMTLQAAHKLKRAVGQVILDGHFNLTHEFV